MKLTSLFLAAALAGSFGSAAAGTYEIDLKGGPLTWSTHKVGAVHSAGTFTDTFTFTNYTADYGVAAGTLVSLWTPVGNLDFTGATLNGVDLPYGNLFGLSGISFNGLEVTGPLTLVISGVVTSPWRGALASYGGDFSVTSAVPEPATYGMLLGGMGVLAFLARRRKA